MGGETFTQVWPGGVEVGIFDAEALHEDSQTAFLPLRFRRRDNACHDCFAAPFRSFARQGGRVGDLGIERDDEAV